MDPSLLWIIAILPSHHLFLPSPLKFFVSMVKYLNLKTGHMMEIGNVCFVLTLGYDCLTTPNSQNLTCPDSENDALT
jgi:hypothetical protein